MEGWIAGIKCAAFSEVAEWAGGGMLSSWEFCIDADKDDCDIARAKGLCMRDEQEYALLCQEDTEVEQLSLF